MNPLAKAVLIMLGKHLDQTPAAIDRASEILSLAASDARLWAKRADDAKRIPDVLAEAASHLRRASLAMDNKRSKTE